MTVHVWDMDGVLNTGNCFYAYLAHRLRSSTLRAARALPILLREKTARSYEARARCGHAIVPVALSGMSLAEYHSDAAGFGAQLAQQPGFVRSQAVAQLNCLHAEGARVIVATACEEHLAASFLRAIGVSYDALSATTFGQASGKVVVAQARDGVRKAQALEALGIDLRQAHFVTDSFDDFPTAKRCRSVQLVNPTDDAERAFQQSGLQFETVRWT